jgi:hypothetical protein
MVPGVHPWLCLNEKAINALLLNPIMSKLLNRKQIIPTLKVGSLYQFKTKNGISFYTIWKSLLTSYSKEELLYNIKKNDIFLVVEKFLEICENSNAYKVLCKDIVGYVIISSRARFYDNEQLIVLI